MRILQTHSDFIEYEPTIKEIKQAEEVERKKYRFEDVLVLFTCVEKGDTGELGKKAMEEVKEFLGKIGSNRILIYPFAHLSRNLASPNDAISVIKAMEEEAKKLKIETHRAPFGWTKSLHLKVKGHPLAEQSKVFEAGKISEKKQEVTRLGKTKVQLEEKLSEKDHRVIGQQLDLFSFHEVSPGMVFWHPNGLIIRNILIDFWREEHRKRGYREINTPFLMNQQLWQISGHWDHYKDLMFFTEIEDQDFAIKPMNCPGAILVFKSTTRSYRDLPIKLNELGIVHRNELSGVLSGMFRIRAMTMDDAHIFVRPEQLEKEIIEVIDLVDHFYKIFGFEYHVEFSTKPKDAMGKEELWKKAEKAIEDSLKKKKMKYKINPGEGAFYGPKIDFHIKDSQGRTWQTATIQIDFQMPERFDINFVGEDGKNHKPVIIHRAVYGTLERFIGILIEHYQGKFPVWLAPISVKVLSISDDNVKYAKKVLEELKESGIRVDGDFESNTIEYKVREAQLKKIPYTLVIGKKEEKKNTVAVRSRDGKVKYDVKLKDFIEQVLEEIEKKK